MVSEKKRCFFRTERKHNGSTNTEHVTVCSFSSLFNATNKTKLNQSEGNPLSFSVPSFLSHLSSLTFTHSKSRNKTRCSQITYATQCNRIIREVARRLPNVTEQTIGSLLLFAFALYATHRTMLRPDLNAVSRFAVK